MRVCGGCHDKGYIYVSHGPGMITEEDVPFCVSSRAAWLSVVCVRQKGTALGY